MREILFRGKRVDNGEWVYGCFYYCKGTAYGATFIVVNDFGFIEVIPHTVGQYTGLTDKNGTKIFEGDIVQLCENAWNNKWRAIVEFGNPNGNYSWGWQLKPIGRVYVSTDILCWVEMEETGAFCEVIGNIYDNPELLQEGKE